ncbi:hypothetical protein ACVOMV_17475 [Mesorhizobium atlanticum]
MQMRIKDSELKPICEAGLRVAGLADEDLGALDPRSFSDRRSFAFLGTVESQISLEKFARESVILRSAAWRWSKIRMPSLPFQSGTHHAFTRRKHP